MGKVFATPDRQILDRRQEVGAHTGQAVLVALRARLVGALWISPPASIRLSRSVRMLRSIPSPEPRKSENRDLPNAMSRMITSVHLSPSTSSEEAIGQSDRKRIANHAARSGGIPETAGSPIVRVGATACRAEVAWYETVSCEKQLTCLRPGRSICRFHFEDQPVFSPASR